MAAAVLAMVMVAEATVAWVRAMVTAEVAMAKVAAMAVEKARAGTGAVEAAGWVGWRVAVVAMQPKEPAVMAVAAQRIRPA